MKNALKMLGTYSRGLYAIALITIIGFSMVSCGGGDDPPPPPPQKTLVSIAVTTEPTKTEYTIGDTLDISGLVVTATYSDGSTAPVSVTAENISGFNSSTAGSKTLTVTYGGKTTTFNVNVKPAGVTLSSIAVTTQPTKTTYTIGEALNISGLVVTATYSNSSTATVSVTAENISGFNSSTTGSKTLTVTYNGKTATFTVTVIATVTLNSVTAVGGTAMTTALRLSFDTAIELTVNDITITGVSGVTKGMLVSSNPSSTLFYLPISGFTSGGTLTVAVAKSGYTVSGSPMQVAINYTNADIMYYGVVSSGTITQLKASNLFVFYQMLNSGSLVLDTIDKNYSVSNPKSITCTGNGMWVIMTPKSLGALTIADSVGPISNANMDITEVTFIGVDYYLYNAKVSGAINLSLKLYY